MDASPWIMQLLVAAFVDSHSWLLALERCHVRSHWEKGAHIVKKLPDANT